MYHGMKGLLRGVAVCVFLFSLTATAAAQNIKLSYNGPADEENNAVHLFAVHFKYGGRGEQGNSVDTVIPR